MRAGTPRCIQRRRNPELLIDVRSKSNGLRGIEAHLADRQRSLEYDEDAAPARRHVEVTQRRGDERNFLDPHG